MKTVRKKRPTEDGFPRVVIMYGADEGRLLSAALTVEKHCSQVALPPLD